MTRATPAIDAGEFRKRQPFLTTASARDGVITITTELPAKCLSPNSRAHWSKVAKAKKLQRQRVRDSVKWFGFRPLWEAATLQARFYWPDRRHRDDDNAMASLKSARDGLADSGVVVNDRVFTTLPAVMGYDKANPRVEIVVQQANSTRRSK